MSFLFLNSFVSGWAKAIYNILLFFIKNYRQLSFVPIDSYLSGATDEREMGLKNPRRMVESRFSEITDGYGARRKVASRV